MNIKVLQWLLAHRDVLLKVVEVAKEFSRHKPYLEQWEVVDKIARLLIPVLSGEDVKPAELVSHSWDDMDLDGVAAFSAGAEMQALGIDWRQLVDIILPVVIAILQALAAKPE